MGLDTTHDCWHGPYSAFHFWRQSVAKAAGLPPLDLMDGHFMPGDIHDHFKLLPSDIRDEYYSVLPISWDCLKPDPLYTLLHHSDCDGEIAAEDCLPIADRLEQLLPEIESDDKSRRLPYSLTALTKQFIVGLRLAAERNEPVEFR